MAIGRHICADCGQPVGLWSFGWKHQTGGGSGRTCGKRPVRIMDKGTHTTNGFQCKARASAADPPQDCDWPACGCDLYAEKVIAAIEESGLLIRNKHALDGKRLGASKTDDSVQCPLCDGTGKDADCERGADGTLHGWAGPCAKCRGTGVIATPPIRLTFTTTELRDICAVIESARDSLDTALNHIGSTDLLQIAAQRMGLQTADKILKQLKKDLGHPKAGLAGNSGG